MKRVGVFLVSLFALVCTIAAASGENDESRVYERVNLVSDIAGVARFTDPNLVNAWGLAFGPTTPFWVADNNGNVATLYNGRGQAFPVGNPLVVQIPAEQSHRGRAYGYRVQRNRRFRHHGRP